MLCWISPHSDFNVHAGPVDTAFVLEHLSYKSPYSDELLVEDLSLKISQDTHLLVVGNTGTGKTSLLRVLNRLWEADSGEMSLLWPLLFRHIKWKSKLVICDNCFSRICPNDNMFWTQGDSFPATEAVPNRWYTAWTGICQSSPPLNLKLFTSIPTILFPRWSTHWRIFTLHQVTGSHWLTCMCANE